MTISGTDIMDATGVLLACKSVAYTCFIKSPLQNVTYLRDANNINNINNNNKETEIKTIEIDWPKFKAYLLLNNNKIITRINFNYAKRYHKVLLDNNASVLLTLSHAKCAHIMRAISALSKYLGKFEDWQATR